MRPGLAPTTPLPPPPHNPHSLQVGSHLALQHRNSFCVSALSHQSSLYSSQQSYSPLSSCGGAPDPFTFSHPHRMHFDELPSEVRLFPPFSFLFFLFARNNIWKFLFQQSSFASRLGIQRARSAPMANGLASSLFGQERDASEMDLNHRLESLCLSMTEHALEGANDI